MDVRIQEMKDYCEIAIRLERQTGMWQSTMNAANKKMSELKVMHRNFQNIISERQKQIGELDFLKKQKFDQTYLLMNKAKRNAFIVLAVMIIFLILGMVWAFSFYAPMLSGNNGTQSAVGIADVIAFGITSMGLPLVICLVIFCINVSKVNRLKKSINNDSIENSKKRQLYVYEDEFQEASRSLEEVKKEEYILLQQQKEIRQALNESLKRRKDFYSIGLIHKAYQNLEAVISFFFYLDTGRVIAIEGPGGMYDTYVKDCQHKELMNTLIEHEKHEQMRHQQLIRTINAVGSEIVSGLGRIERATVASAISNAETARNSKIIAESNRQQEEDWKEMRDRRRFGF